MTGRTFSGWHGRRAVVTGGHGFIGSNLTIALSQIGVHVLVIDRVDEGVTPPRSVLAPLKGELLELDLAQVFEGVDTVFHLAARTSPRVNIQPGL